MCLSGTFQKDTILKGRLPECEGAGQSASLTAIRLTAHSESVLPGSASSWGCILYLQAKIIKTTRFDVEALSNDWGG